MSLRNQCSQWIFGIVCFGLLASSISIGWAQEEESSGRASIVGRFTSLKNKFRREQPQAKKSTVKSTQKPSRRNSRHRPATKQASQQPASANSKRGIQASDLVPNGVFSRQSSTPKTLPKPLEPWQSTRSASLPRAGSRVSKPAVRKTAVEQLARRSPSTSPSMSRANELNDALADLMQDDDAPLSQQAVVKPSKQAKSVKRSMPKAPRLSTAVSRNTFDLHKALLNNEEDADTEEVAETATELAEAKSVARKQEQVEQAPKEKSVAEQSVEKIKPQIVAEPVFEVASPKPASIERTPQVIQQKVLAKPSDGAARKAFAIPQQTNNPMRSFLPVAEKVEPVEQIALPTRRVLQTSRQPVIVSHVEGPRSILVGREATYQVTLENTSDVTSSDLSAEIRVPEWAELVDAMSTSGVVERVSEGVNAGALQWKLSKLAPHSSQALRLRLIPHSGRPLQLGVRWSQAPMESEAIIEVQEPKLELAISGPREVHFGKPQRYRLTLSNPGTGVTEKVSVRLVPPGGDAQDATTQLIGDLQPGEVKDIDLELTAREAGELLIQAGAFSKGGLKAEMNKTVLCRKPELEIEWRGPDKKYAGTVAAYYLRVSNPGTAATEPITMSVKLPANTEFVSASEGSSVNSATGNSAKGGSATSVVSWRLGALAAGAEQFIQLRCKIAQPGSNNFEAFASTTDDTLSARKTFQTEVEALADLKLEVTDPQGPLPMGEQVVYEIRVQNRGTTAAEEISVVGLFSEGIDPTTVEGAQFSIRDGRVSFHPIKNLPAGREVLLRIHAKASRAGTHIFRAEVVCQKLEIKLAAEETTRFFEDEHHWEDGETPYSAERKKSVSR